MTNKLFSSLIMLLLSASCQPAPGGNNAAAGERREPIADVRLALLPPSREGDAALTIGRLAVEGPCLYLIRDDGTRTMPAFITFDTRWENGALVVGDRRFVVGQRVKLGGGEVNGAVANMVWTQAPDRTCATAKLWVTVSVDPA